MKNVALKPKRFNEKHCIAMANITILWQWRFCARNGRYCPMIGNNLLQGELVRLDSVRQGDVEYFAKWLVDLDVTYTYEDEVVYPYPPEAHQEHFENTQKTLREGKRIKFTIRTLSDDIPIGSAGMFSVDYRNGNAGI